MKEQAAAGHKKGGPPVDKRVRPAMPKVSVIIPTYNRAEFVTKAIQSVLGQSFKDYEIIVIDDGSTDATREALAPYMDRIHYIHQKNSGVSSARNAGILQSRGEWISFLDSDDEWMENNLSTQMAHIEEFPRAVAHVANATNVRLDGTETSHFSETGFLSLFDGTECLVPERPLRLIIQYGPWFLQSSILHKVTLLQAGLFDTDLSIAEDLDVLARVALKGPFSFCEDPLAKIVRRQETVENLTDRAFKNGLYRHRSFSKVYRNILTCGDLRRREKMATAAALSRHRRALGTALIAIAEKSEARKLFVKAFSVYPSPRSAFKLLASYLPYPLARAAVLEPGRLIQGANGSQNRTAHSQSYRQILKSTSILGGSSAINIGLRIIRTKFLAVLLGPAGIGLLGVYTSIADMIGAVARMGIDSSGVRQIAEGTGNADEEKVGRTLYVLRRVAFFSGLLGMVLLILLSHLISRVTFQDTAYTSDIIILSLSILLDTIVAGELARLQGMRRIGDLARVSVFSATFGTVISIPVVYAFGQKGIVFFLIASSASSMVIARWYAGRIRMSGFRPTWTGIRAEVRPLLQLGFAVMVADLMGRGTGYLLRLLVLRQFGLAASGLYQVAMTLSSIYVGFILESMVKDYYPRLAAVANDSASSNKLVNEQVEIGTLLAVPGILAMLTFAPTVIQLFYTSKFSGAFEIFRWGVLGMLLRVVTWPMGFILQAKGLAGLYLLTDFLMNCAHVVLVWVGLSHFGLNGTGIGFFCMCGFYWIMIYGLAKSLTGFTWSPANIRNALLVIPAVCIVFLSHFFLDRFWQPVLGAAISVSFAVYACKTLRNVANSGGVLQLLSYMRRHFFTKAISRD